MSSAPGAGEPRRWSLETLDLEDENTGTNPQAVEVRRLNLKLLTANHDSSGYEMIPIARIEKSARPDPTPQRAPAYFPPLLACDAWQPLRAGVIEQLFDRIG